MRKQILLSFFWGAVVPLVLLAGAVQNTRAETEYSEPAQTTAAAVQSVDGAIPVTVLTADGEMVEMTLEEYLTGVVLAEMPASFDAEALKAQAVVARTYTCRRMENPRHGSAVVCMDSGCCQGYLSAEDYVNQGGEAASAEKVSRAVAGTDGQVLTYDGALIDATYFSCSGGMTEDAVAVWGQDVPYLQAVESPGEEDAPRYSDSVTFSAAQLRQILGCGTGSPGGWFGSVTYTDGGGVDTMEICGETFTGVQLRSLLGLRSTAFTVTVSGDTVTFETRGFGHRVGMSQYGAQAMARSGSGYADILAHYYQGTQLGLLNAG